MTNKPMLSVERELLERAASAIEKHHGSLQWVIATELRALLDKPAATDFESWWAETGEQLTKHEIGLKDLMRCAYEAVPAAQHQGEPVAWIKPDVAKTLTKDECCYAFGSQNPKGTLIPLYAEQPAPVAPASQCAPCNGKGSISDDDGIDMGICNFCDGSGAKSVAVVMPERKPDPGMVAGMMSKWAQGWNEALDDVARLNGVKP